MHMRETAGAARTRSSRALCFQDGQRNAKLRAHRAARRLPAVIVREGGRSSIPETFMIESISRGVLDTPPSRSMTTVGVPSIRLDRQRCVLRPFAHRAVIEREISVTEPMQQKQVDRGRDAAAAIGDHALVFRDALRGEFRFGVGQRNERLGRGIEQRRRRDVAAAGNAAGPAVAARLQAFVKLRTERIDDDGVARGGGFERRVLVDEKSRLSASP